MLIKILIALESEENRIKIEFCNYPLSWLLIYYFYLRNGKLFLGKQIRTHVNITLMQLIFYIINFHKLLRLFFILNYQGKLFSKLMVKKKSSGRRVVIPKIFPMVAPLVIV